MGEIILEAAEYTKETDSSGCTKLVVFCNAPDDNPFMAGAFHGVTEADQIINVGEMCIRDSPVPGNCRNGTSGGRRGF